MSYCVYCHTNKIDGKKYVGITGQKPEKRWGNGRNYSHNAYFDNAIKKYGWEEFSHEILFTGLSKKEAEDKEIELIAKWGLTNRDNGYNLSNGGEGAASLTDEIKKKISEAKKGQTLSEESKRKMSISRTGNKHSRSIPIGQYTDDGTLIRTYVNSREAEAITGICGRNIRKCVQGQRSHAGGFVWRKILS